MHGQVPGPADDGPGSDATLNALYDLVPDAEEVDLAEEVRLEQEQSWALENAGFVEEGRLAPVEDQAPDEPPTPAPDERLTDNQVQGLLEHVLGAEVLDDEDPRGHET
ncbi:hypothetical protein [Nocardioides psychrotolerans]|uniref:hypothetical protein n=1 Tax=Nocardioides psychrotolerans TaxID=1005945 RepID=UPI00313816E1